MDLYTEIEKCLPRVERRFSETALLAFSQSNPEDLVKYNIGLGTIIRVKLLRPKSSLYKVFIQNGYVDKGAMTMLVISKFFEYLHKKKDC